MKIILGIQVSARHEDALATQRILTEHGCVIKTRLGLHEQKLNSCSEKGLILLELLEGCEEECAVMEKELIDIGNNVVRKMEF